MRCELRRRARERRRIDAAVGREAPVLVGEQQIEEARIDASGRTGSRQRPSAVA